mgnify:CR=1 FL=1
MRKFSPGKLASYTDISPLQLEADDFSERSIQFAGQPVVSALAILSGLLIDYGDSRLIGPGGRVECHRRLTGKHVYHVAPGLIRCSGIAHKP